MHEHPLDSELSANWGFAREGGSLRVGPGGLTQHQSTTVSDGAAPLSLQFIASIFFLLMILTATCRPVCMCSPSFTCHQQPIE